ncbi:MAG: TldD/PmbA family protein [Lachnospiraceae bacterium]|nr:TldD/PmbA family protein [Lachnospiraceae bacterium]
MRKVESSAYLQGVKPLLKELLNKVLQEYPYASILAVDAQSESYRVTTSVTSMGEDGLLSGRGFVIKAYDGQAYGEYSFNDISEEKLEDVLEHLRAVTALKDCDGVESLSQYKILADEPCVFAESTEYETDARELGDEEILRRLAELKDSCEAYDERVIQGSVSLNYQKYSKLFLSPNRDMEQNVMWTNGSMMIAVQKDQQVKYSYQGFSKLGGVELLDTMGGAIDRIGKNAVDLLEAEPMIPGEYDCICTPPVTGMIAHEAFGHGVEMDMFVKDRALAKGCVGEYVASPLLTMHDGASMESRLETASYFFDDEGTLSTDTIIIKDGVLQTGISDAQSAMSLGTVPTGNGRRESYKRKAYTRMTNTWFEPGKDKVEDMIASIDYGFLLDDASSGMEDPKNWGIQMMVNIAREIKDGKLTGRIYSPVVLTGYVPDLLKSITMMSDEAELCGSGFCGKGYKEWAKVSDGGPYIKAKIRLG